MKFILLFIALFISCHFTFGQDSSLDFDEEQQQLSLCYKYSNELGFNIDAVSNPNLYESINEWIGTPYHYSGESKNGIDCSGFVCKLYKSAYKENISGSAKELYNLVDPIKKTELKEGDLVFFKIRKRRISHVGIYLGENKFAHASSHSGVIISDLDEEYYKKYFFKGGRLVR